MIAPSATKLPSGVWLALASLYFIWGSTYLAIRVALEGFPPLYLAGIRFVLAGLLLLGWQRLRGVPLPSRRQWGASVIVGALLVGGNTLVTVAEQWVSSGLAAVAIGSVPLWVALLSGLFGRWPTGREWLGVSVGFVGLFVLIFGSTLTLAGQPLGIALLVLSTMVWSLGTMLNKRLPMPAGLSGSGALMLAGGLLDLGLAAMKGEHFAQAPSGRALFAFFWLVLLGSVIAYSAFTYLLDRVKPTLATSYAYVNPVVAVGLGALLLGEPLTLPMLAALALILSGVGLLARARSAG